jgi:hypothetical protein
MFLSSYSDFTLVFAMRWEQGVGGSNPLAPTITLMGHGQNL